ncbi:FAD-dependent oxidoreductase [Mycobacterium avium subsp. paratuberculosis]|uniref:ferredoxin--NADP(+) reductase n=10 Tax=Mycobacterium avium TaxID=1764 RepID=Q742L0_MYCPA|nr:FAD-dependent oxidoreductase [Mycobacterium avium]ETA99763.1 ferredoxin [Mycobacterium avium subsp. paratuberculosis 10-4404]ETB02203.1 ferredoxin [Mycobacterium avium subsp. paratuberculosis 10-5864]AAS03142.1 FprB [Mycobacterium avium subsp. paratuberculosis K-10]AGL37910.1 NADPH:adrenodoxin oxidoreductase FprB [Mycobacterium avium subsp. paratuberculosis MAP4]ANH27649.1 ferredoxin [Mycobacterium avium subsp. paratuberculosis]
MPHVITQSCCNDGSCVFACPVNCIHPTPDEPGFATSEMLYIDPAACVDCGACVSACPVGAIAPDNRLDDKQLPFVEINASFYPKRPAGQKLPPTSKLAPVIPAVPVRPRGRPLTVAIVGSGPAAMYAADELLTQDGVRVNVFEKLPTPYGLVRAGVAPDHQNTKKVTRLFDRVAGHDRFRFYLNVEVGKHLSHADLLAHHHAVLYAVGAPDDRRLDIEGMGLAGSGTATELVAWINGHPEFTALPVDLRHERVVIIGNGNVALDVARVLTADPDDLARTDIADHALAALRGSAVREVVIAARRGPAQSAFTLPELIGLTGSREVVLSAADRELVAADLANASDALTKAKLEVLSTLGDAAAPSERPRIRLAYRLTPDRILGEQRVTGVQFTLTGTDETRCLPTGLVLTSIGYRGKPIRDLPYDEAAAVVPNDGGRVVDPASGRPVPGAYVAGWIKRGPSGFIGTNKSCSLQTVQALVADFNAGELADPAAKPEALTALVRARRPDAIDAAGWRAIDAAEIARGSQDGRPRNKFTDIGDMLAAAAAAEPAPPPRRRLLARLVPSGRG